MREGFSKRCIPFSKFSGTAISGFSDKNGGNFDESDIKIPELPTNCCMSGCANCVWIQYAEELTKIFKDGGDKSREIILKKVDDPNMKAFLSLELTKLRGK
uniref:Oxidoreductase-like domain-containing protein n=1 Tax=Rhodnius prolixus TaxID=13249 RepID=T1I0R3_RHOPR